MWGDVLSHIEEAGADPTDNTIFTLRPAGADLGLQDAIQRSELSRQPALTKSASRPGKTDRFAGSNGSLSQ